MLDGAHCELAWPRSIFMAEAHALVATGHGATARRLEWLLEEAFTSSAPMEIFTPHQADLAVPRLRRSLGNGRYY